MVRNKIKMVDIENIVSSVLNDFANQYLSKKNTLHNLTNMSNRVINDLYKVIINNILEKKYESISELIKPLSDIYVGLNIQYEEFKNELIFMQRSLFKVVLQKGDNQRALELLTLFDDIDSFVTQEFLNKHLNNIIENNNQRLNTIEIDIQDEMLLYYEAHIRWVNQLALSILKIDITIIPEVCPNSCTFGIWLNSDDSRNIISNTNDYLNMHEIHKKLHNIAQDIKPLLDQKDNHTHSFLAYVREAEEISKIIGLKLSNISNEITRKKSSLDTLTGVLNRELLNTLFSKQIDVHLATTNPMVFAICDLDHFKNINDKYGHIAGDKVLKAFASLLKEHLRSTDIIIRYGGEEFIVIIPNANLSQGKQILNNFMTKLHKEIIVYNDDEIQVTVSIGLIELQALTLDYKNFGIAKILEDTIAQADKLLYKAKENGRDRIEV
jgi:diguanylate cyclase (GGDEF)-like protein